MVPLGHTPWRLWPDFKSRQAEPHKGRGVSRCSLTYTCISPSFLLLFKAKGFGARDFDLNPDLPDNCWSPQVSYLTFCNPPFFH